MKAIGTIFARFFMTAIFIGSAVQKIANPKDTILRMSEAEIPHASTMYVGAIIFLLAGGLSVLLGYKTKIGAILILTYLVLVTYFFHRFWTFPENQQSTQLVAFLHNLGLFGAFTFVLFNGPGPGNLDSLVSNREPASSA